MSNQAETVKPKKTMEDKWKSIDSLPRWYNYASKAIGEQSGLFLRSTRPFLTSGEHGSACKGILNNWDFGLIPAHLCVEQCFAALVTWHGQKGLQDAKDNAHKHNWNVNLFAEGKLQMEKTFDDYKSAHAWADNRLVEQASDAYAVIDARLEKTVIRITRNEAMYRTRQVSHSPVCKTTSKTTGTLSWGQSKRGSTRVFFSRG